MIIVTIIFAMVFVALIFIIGIRAGIAQSDNKWLKVIKENSSGAEETIKKLQEKLKSKNEELVQLKEKKKNLKEEIEKLKSDLGSQKVTIEQLNIDISKAERLKCNYKDGLILDSEGNYQCPLSKK